MALFLRYTVCLSFILIMGSPPLFAQPKPGTATTPVEEVPLTQDTIQKRIQLLETAKELDGAIRKEAIGLYSEALLQLDLFQQYTGKIKEIEQAKLTAPKQARELERALKKASKEPPPSLPSRMSPEDSKTALDQAEKTLAEVSQELSKTKDERLQWQERRKQLPDLIRAAQDKAKEIKQALAVFSPGGNAQVATARKTLLRARLNAANKEIELLEKELASHEDQGKLYQLRFDLYSTKEQVAKKQVDILQEAVGRVRKEEVEKKKERAEKELEIAEEIHPVARRIAEENLALVDRLAGPKGLIVGLEKITKEISIADERLKKIRTNHQGLIERIKVVGMTDIIGLLLRQQRSNLPNLRLLYRNVQLTQREMAKVQFQVIDLREQRDSLVNVADRVKTIMENLQPPISDQLKPKLESRLFELLNKQRDNLQGLIEHIDTYINKLVDLDSTLRQLIEETETFATYIDEHVLWIRSASFFGWSHIQQIPHALLWLTGIQQWMELINAFRQDISQRWFLYIFIVMLLAVFLSIKRTIKGQLNYLADQVSDWKKDSFLFTVKSFFYTVILSFLWPIIFWFIGWRLSAVVTAGDFPKAIGAAFILSGTVLLCTGAIRKICRDRGLGEVHLRWPAEAMREIRFRVLNWTTLALPLIFLLVLLESQPVVSFKESLGRVVYIALMIITSFLLHYLLRPHGKLLISLTKRTPQSFFIRFGKLWGALGVLLPLLLAILAAAGYYFTSLQLTYPLLLSVLLVLVLITVHSLILRWLYVARRRLSLARWEERKKEDEQESKKEVTAMGKQKEFETDKAKAKTEISIMEINQHTRNLIQWILLISGIVGLYLVWIDLLPALGIFGKIRLWGTPVTEGGAGVVTLSELIVVFFVLYIVVIASKNVPGILELLFLRHLPIDPGGKYAITKLTQYTLIIAGVLVMGGLVGLSWASMQWLVAALTVGLGFGLQEIFANFVSGLIILFERPIRVDDVVTIGDITGKVARIRIRATTIVDWNRKELIVPNKEFITGQLINWTLSDEVVRVVVPVGVAYGSDTDLTYKTLLRVARETPNVMKDPEPRVLFMEFGDSSLNFELRVFVPHIDYFLEVRHILHMNIDMAFREADIEISFPQRDLHLRSIDTQIMEKFGKI